MEFNIMNEIRMQLQNQQIRQRFLLCQNMTSTDPNNKDCKIVAYSCRFQLVLNELQVQSYFASSYQVLWETKNGQQLANTRYKLKGHNKQIDFDQMLQAQTTMLYNKQTKTYIDKDTFIVVNYYPNSRPDAVKQLGRLTIKMGKLMQQMGRQPLRKGQVNEDPSSFSRSKNIGQSANKDATNDKRTVQTKIRNMDDFRCLRLQTSQYNAKLKFKCILVQSQQSQISIQQLSAEQFNQTSLNDNGIRQSTARNQMQKLEPSKIAAQNSKKVNGQREMMKPITQNIGMQKQAVHNSQFPCSNNKDLLKTSHNTQSMSLFPSVKNSLKQVNNASKQQEQVLIQTQYLQQRNYNQQQTLKRLQQTNEQLRKDYQQLQDESKQKELYFQANLQKLQEMDQLKFQLLQIKDYVERLEQKLTKKYNDKLDTLKPTNGSSHLIKQENKHRLFDQDNIRISQITLFREESLRQSKKNLAESLSFMNISARKKQSSNENDFILTPGSEMHLTNSEMKQVEGQTTMRMRGQLSFMQTQLYQVRQQLTFQQTKLQNQYNLHYETKQQLYRQQQLISQLQKQNEQIITTFNQLQQQNHLLKQLNHQVDARMQQFNKQFFKVKEEKSDVEYQLSMTVKQQRIQLEVNKEHLKQVERQLTETQQKYQEKVRRQEQLQREGYKINNEMVAIKTINRKLGKQVNQFRSKDEKLSQYLVNLQTQINEVYKIVQDKEKQYEQLQNWLQYKQEQTQKLKQGIFQLQNTIKGIMMTFQNQQKQLVIQRIRVNTSQKPQNNTQSTRQAQLTQNKVIALLQINKELILKNKQLISLVNKNATNMVLLQKQIKQTTQLKRFNQEVSDLKIQNQSLKESNKKVQKELNKMKVVALRAQQKLQRQISAFQTKNKQLQLITEQLQKKNKQQMQININIKQINVEQQNKLSQKQKKLAQSQIKLSRTYKQKRLLQQTQKILYNQNKNLESVLMLQQSSKQTNQFLIKQLQVKLSHYQIFNQVNNYESLRNSPYQYGQVQGMSEIKLQPEICLKKSKNMQANRLKHSKNIQKQFSQDNSVKNQQSIYVKDLLTQIQVFKQQLQAHKVSTEASEQKVKIQTLQALFRSYMQQKLQNSKFSQILQKSICLKLKDSNDQYNDQAQQVIKKAKNVIKQIHKYKAQILKLSKSSNKNGLQSVVMSSLKPVQKAINQLINST